MKRVYSIRKARKTQGDTAARLQLARDLTSGQWHRANLILRLPLFEVAYAGREAMREVMPAGMRLTA